MTAEREKLIKEVLASLSQSPVEGITILSVDTSPYTQGRAEVIITYQIGKEILKNLLTEMTIHTGGVFPKYETREVGHFEKS